VTYRQDIQILRGISVLFVLAYHFGIPGIKSGFLGVDIFFVISGFIMSKIYDPSDKKGFFERRALRLLPAYFSTIFFTILVSIFVVTPNEFSQVSAQSLFSIFFASNLGFWAQSSYFSSNEFNPLLHLWSLGVEIQFYLVMPLLLYFFRMNKVFFMLIMVVSLLLCLFMITVSPKTSFFMMPLRLWEFLIGFGVAQYAMPNKSNGLKNNFLLSTVGMILILIIPFIGIDGQSFSLVNGHPGFAAIAIVLSTGLILLYGIGFFNYFHSIGRVLEKIGQYSYSIYLIHFPVIVLFMYQPFSGTRLEIAGQFSYILMLTIVLSYLSYQFIEIKLKKSRNIRNVLIIYPFVIILLIWFGGVIQKNIFSDKQFKISNALSERTEYRCGKTFKVLNPFKKICSIGEESVERVKKVLLMGDSHADTIKIPFSNIANNNNINTYFFVKKLFLVNEYESNGKMQINEQIRINDVIAVLLNKNINHIVVHYKHGNVDSDVIELLVKEASKYEIKVSYITPVPVYNKHIPRILWSDNALDIVKSRSDYNKTIEKHLKRLKRIKENNFNIYNVADYLCEEECKIVSDDGRPYYFDSDHLTITGAELLNPLFRKISRQ
jgi:peptidoglycan/LPS O-acetylase OafA/YrhL